jgi:hypothetical protein
MTLTDISSSALRGPLGLNPHGCVLFALDELWLVVPQVDVVGIEHGSEFSAPDAVQSRIAWFETSRGYLPVCVLDSSLQPCDTLHASGSYLVFVRSYPVPIGLRCQSVRIVGARSALEVHPLPAVMQGGVVSGVARIDRSHLAFVLGEGKLPTYLADLLAREESRE